MPKINVLPQSVAELIAAGEVVERPLSVVKELVENSIDAGASSVTVEIKNGGVTYIRVTDNGCGIAADEIRTAFVSHATSKIGTAADLDRIFTLGFRGEALPSIAAVSRVTVLTRTPEAEAGVSFSLEGGKETACEPAGCPVGTTVVVRDLFFNTPARLKFLKKDVTEGNYVADIVTRTALAHPEIRFTLIRDEKTALRTPGAGDLYETVYALFGKELAEGLLPCSYSYHDIEVSGFISKPLNNRPNRNMQYFFVNGRSVRLPAAAPALDNAYKNSIMVGKFPVCFLSLKLDASKTDVNVHPAKTEIRFTDETKLFETVYYAARSALAKGDTERPAVRLREQDLLRKPQPEHAQLKFVQPLPAWETPSAASAQQPAGSVPHARREAAPQPQRATAPVPPAPVRTQDVYRERNDKIDISYSEPEPVRPAPAPQPAPDPLLTFRDGNFTSIPESAISASNRPRQTPPASERKEEAPEPPPEPIAEEQEAPPAVRVIGEAFKTYIIAECENRLLLIDKHAAHERMLFNDLMAHAGADVASQLLLSPAAVTLSGKEYAAVLENLPVLQKAGFEVEDFGGGTVLVRACPVILTFEDAGALLQEIAGEFADGNLRPEPEKLSWIYHSAACRAAVKAGDELKPAEMQDFTERLLRDPEVRYCPHGRPVLYELSKYELEKRFGRIT